MRIPLRLVAAILLLAMPLGAEQLWTPGMAPGQPEDSPHVSGDYGEPLWVVRNDAGAALCGDGDYCPMTTDATGAVRIAGSFSGGGDGAIQDGTTSTIEATVLDLLNSNPLTTAIVDANGDQISSFGGGTQYTEGDVDASITGTAMMFEGAANTLVAAPGTAADGLLVNLGANNDVVASATNLDVRDLVFASDKVDASGTTLGANSGVDIGDVTVNNATIAVTQSGTWTVQPGNTANTTPWLMSIHDGTTKASVRDLAANDSLNVAIVDGAGDQITSFGGGTQYTEGDTDASITGTAMLWEDAADTLRAVSAAKPLPIDITDSTVAVTQSGTWDEVGINDSGNSITVDGSVTANAGTNLNTSALNLEATQSSVLTSVQLIDDVVYTDDTSTHSTGSSKGALTMAAAVPTDTSVDANDIAAVGMTTDRRLYTEATQSGTWNVTNISGTVSLPTGASTLAEQQTQTTSLQLADDVVNTDDTSTHTTGSSKGTLFMAAATPTDASVNANDIGAVAMTTDRKLHVSVQDALPAGTNGIGKLTANSGVDIGDVDVTTVGTVTPGTGATALGKAEDNAHSSGDVGVVALAHANEANTALAADNDYVPIATDTEGNTRVVGNRDHDAADAGEPVKVGMKAVSLGADPTAVAGNDRTDWYATRAGIPFVLGGHPNILAKQFNITDADGAQTDLNLLNATVGATDRVVVTMIQVTLDSATTATGGVAVRIGCGAANTPANDSLGILLSHPGIAAGSGVVAGGGMGILGICADGEELRMTSEDPTGGNLDVITHYFIISDS